VEELDMESEDFVAAVLPSDADEDEVSLGAEDEVALGAEDEITLGAELVVEVVFREEESVILK
jgi:hypothetical protein